MFFDKDLFGGFIFSEKESRSSAKLLLFALWQIHLISEGPQKKGGTFQTRQWGSIDTLSSVFAYGVLGMPVCTGMHVRMHTHVS